MRLRLTIQEQFRRGNATWARRRVWPSAAIENCQRRREGHDAPQGQGECFYSESCSIDGTVIEARRAGRGWSTSADLRAEGNIHIPTNHG